MLAAGAVRRWPASANAAHKLTLQLGHSVGAGQSPKVSFLELPGADSIPGVSPRNAHHDLMDCALGLRIHLVDGFCEYQIRHIKFFGSLAGGPFKLAKKPTRRQIKDIPKPAQLATIDGQNAFFDLPDTSWKHAQSRCQDLLGYRPVFPHTGNFPSQCDPTAHCPLQAFGIGSWLFHHPHRQSIHNGYLQEVYRVLALILHIM